MTNTPFWDRAREVAATQDYVLMQANSDSARSHGWWRKLCTSGPWGSPSYPYTSSGRVGPPDREAIPGIAKLFGTTEQRVAEMIAADWYDVHLDTEVSARVLRIADVLDTLDDDDLALVEQLARRLQPEPD